MMQAPEPETTPGHVLPRRYALFEDTRCCDPQWHYRIGLPRGAGIAPGPSSSPMVKRGVVLGSFRLGRPSTEVSVAGLALEHEVDPADVLDTCLSVEEIVGAQRLPTAGGAAGDVLCRSKREGGTFLSRHFACKFGSRLFVVSCRAKEEHYEDVAESFSVAVSRFSPVQPSGLFAEGMHEVTFQKPEAWSVAIPASWHLELEPPTSQVASLQAEQSPGRPLEHPELLAGKLSLAVVSRRSPRTAAELAGAFLSALRERAILVDNEIFEPAAPPGSFLQAWSLVSPASRLGAPGEVRGRVLLGPSHWVVAGVVGPRREVGAEAWMRNKRALEVALSTLLLRGDQP